ncbi:MAG: hypothetical protein J6S61_03410 [Elusimicrobiaceae bacterium]|nr:hypothetical protein [Elusimicrobiaceae bacterium]
MSKEPIAIIGIGVLLTGKGGILSQVKKLENLGAKSGKKLPEIDFEEGK